MLTVESLSAGYDGKTVLQNISFALPQGQRLAVVGPNGCGKTTLLRCLAGVLSYSGRVLLDDREIGQIPRRQLAMRVAMLSQITHVYFDYNIYDTVMMGRYAHSRGRLLADRSDADEAAVEAALRQTRLWELRQRGIATLSGGQLQRVFLARLLAQQPDIILLDEPTNHLDLSYQVELIDFLRLWSMEQNKSIVGVLHDLSQAVRLADRLLLLQEGHTAALGTPSEVLAGETLRQVYGLDVAAYMKETLKIWETL